MVDINQNFRIPAEWLETKFSSFSIQHEHYNLNFESPVVILPQFEMLPDFRPHTRFLIGLNVQAWDGDDQGTHLQTALYDDESAVLYGVGRNFEGVIAAPPVLSGQLVFPSAHPGFASLATNPALFPFRLHRNGTYAIGATGINHEVNMSYSHTIHAWIRAGQRCDFVTVPIINAAGEEWSVKVYSVWAVGQLKEGINVPFV